MKEEDTPPTEGWSNTVKKEESPEIKPLDIDGLDRTLATVPETEGMNNYESKGGWCWVCTHILDNGACLVPEEHTKNLNKYVSSVLQTESERIRNILGKWLLEEKIVYSEDHFFGHEKRFKNETPCVDDLLSALREKR